VVRRLLLGIVVVAVIAFTVVNLTVAPLPPMPAATGDYFAVHGREIHYVEQPGSGVPVVMLHGLPGTNEDFDPVVAKLPGAHVYSLDRPGFGWSRGGWLKYQNQIDVVHEFLTQLRLTPAIVVGHSFGGAVALGLARRYPNDVAKLVLIAPAAGGLRSLTMNRFQARYVRFSQLPVVKSVVKHTFGNVALRLSAYLGARNAFEPAPVPADYKERLLSVSLTPGNLAAYAGDQLEFDDTIRWVDANVGEIRVPTVVIAAVDDELVPIEHARKLAAELPGSRLVTVDGNHMIPYIHPDVVATAIRG
jgi:pimeloyl-ACP methyl ester carboxylesterase